MKQEAWIPTSKAGRLIDRSRDQVVRLIDAGKLEAKMTPLGRLVSRASIVRFLAERDTTPPTAAAR